MAHLFILDVYVRPNRKYVNLSLIYYVLDFSFSCPKMTLISIFTRMTLLSDIASEVVLVVNSLPDYLSGGQHFQRQNYDWCYMNLSSHAFVRLQQASETD